MLKRLKSALRSPKGSRLALALRAIILGTLLYSSGQGWFWFVLFWAAVLYFYFSRLFDAQRFLGSFLVLLGCALGLMGRFPDPDLTRFWLSFLFAGLFFLILGIKNLVFIPRRAYYFILNNSLFGLCFILFFTAEEPWACGINYLLLGLAGYLLARESLAFNFESPVIHAQPTLFVPKNLVTLIFVFLLLQFAWVVALLPFGFLSASASALLFILMLQDLFLNYWSGTLARNTILRDATIFLAAILAIFASSRWFF